MLLIRSNLWKVPQDCNHLLEVLDKFGLTNLLVKNRNSLLSLLSDLVEDVLFLFLHVNRFSSSLSWEKIWTGRFTDVTSEIAFLGCLFFVKFDISLLRVFRIIAEILVIEHILSCSSASLVLTLKSINKAWDHRADDFLPFLERISVRHAFNVLHTINYVITHWLQ